ncbi:MAG: hypothetical protein GWM98_20950, partial [Nitrospinaceae bacterium]|nr:undecaprenyl-diphosphate phosphatase [Nitrospinaceae bacterium]NIR56486.1 undecaprenyl-diphosphate phosphatase [Nitrospinaceae bacterium]NIS86944.1 undecaprenyl-diphosphate phosphatase [Nitrospinaceae bacterium]NIT83788.1 undecaprenyl-diphosphate phosphatase [Nitrospinaceae bacterium]NIU45994.1 undecaprenyl-diphosphate phosphatase [Nitrospinaceae bacterium]
MDDTTLLLLSLIQGLTEFLPISSSGHLILAPIVFEFKDQGLILDAILHLGTLLAIIIFFRRDLSKLLFSLFDRHSDPAMNRLAWYILIATLPAGLAGLLWNEQIETHLRNPSFVAWNMLFWSLVFLVSDRWAYRKRRPDLGIKDLTLGQVLWVGVAQAMALLPGTSRSGVTMAAGLFSRLSHTTAARFSFLLGTPIILAAGLYELGAFFSLPPDHMAYTPAQLGMGFLVTFGVGYLAIKVLLEIVSRLGLLPFILYRAVLATAILL